MRTRTAAALLLMITMAASAVPAVMGAENDRASESEVRWGWDAHKMICQMAYWQLNERARAAVDEFIADDPRYDRFAESCLWADEVRGRDEKYDRYRTAHYVNLPRGADAFSLDRDCADTYCAVEAIMDARSALADPETGHDERLDAFKFLSHFVSDIHQPLHAGYADDRGGNDLDLTLFGNETNMHAAWDYGLLEHSGQPWVNYASLLYFDMTEEQKTRWATTLSPAEWAVESFSVVSSTAYDVPEDGVIGTDYYDRHIGVLEQRLQMASVRLAAILNEVLGG